MIVLLMNQKNIDNWFYKKKKIGIYFFNFNWEGNLNNQLFNFI